MKYLKRFNEGFKNIYDVVWEKILPPTLTILKDGEHTFKVGNIMKNVDMVQVTYTNTKNESLGKRLSKAAIVWPLAKVAVAIR